MFGFSLFGCNKARRSLLRPVLTLCLAALLLIPAAADDLPYYQVPIERLSSWNVMSGYPDGGFYPDRSITRAEFVAMVNRAYGYTETGPTPFSDVPETAWYADDIAIAYNAGYFSGTSPSTASPGANLTREQAMVLLAKNMRLEAIPGEVTQFTDGRDFSAYSKGYVKAAVQHGLIAGFPDGSFQPKAPITRGQMATILSSALGTLVPDSGEHSLGNVFGNVTLNHSNTTLRDTIIDGDLYISGGLGLGAVTLDNVRVLGKIVVAGGGVSETGEDSVVLVNTEADNLLVDSLTGQYLSLRAEGDTLIPEGNIRSDAFVQDRSRTGYGLLSLTLDGSKPNSQYTLSGNLGNIFNKSPSSSLTLSKGTLASLTIDEAAMGSKLIIDNDATVKELNLDTGVPVTGSGDIDKLNVNAAGTSTSMLPDKIAIRPGLTAGIAGENMNTQLGEESSADPRLLAGYPKAKDVAPTSLTAVFSGNKSGTVYWAVSAISDGSIDEAALISPASYGSKAVKSGNLQLTTSNTEVPAKITGLSSGGSYYLSAVMVDARGTHSPVKVISFENPDSSAPNFAKGYPVISRMRTSADHSASAQVKVMATKSCDLYYAVLPADAAAPTADDFKTSNISGNKGFGIHRMTKNVEQYITVSDSLVEQENYAVYLWLTDSDGAKSSAVKKLTFTTPDGTPPEFLVHPTRTEKKDKELQFTFTVSELCDIYWVAVPSGKAYPTPPANGTLTEAYVQDSIMKHNGSPVKYGSVKNVKPNAGATIKITQLTPATAYDIYYVAADKAKPFVNYSAVNLAAPTGSYMVTASTTDNIKPTVTLKTLYLPGTSTAPNAPKNLLCVRLIFSEGVRVSAADNFSTLSFQTLYNNVTSAKSEAEADIARTRLSNALKSVLTLTKERPGGDDVKVRDGSTPVNTTEDFVDYRYATVSTGEDGKVTVELARSNNDEYSALRLHEGSPYVFTIQKVVDLNGYLSEDGTPNPLDPDPTYLPFTVESETPRFFMAGTPRIGVHDTFIDFTYGLAGEGSPYAQGTVHYYAVPISAMDIPATVTSKDNNETKEKFPNGKPIITTGIPISDTDYTAIPTQGLDQAGFNNTTTYPGHIYYPLSSPDGSSIIAKANSTKLSKGSVAGKLPRFTEQNPITERITGLLENTQYLLYLTIQEGNVPPSTPQLFRFTTTNPEKPVLEAVRSTDNAGVTVYNRERKPNQGEFTELDNTVDANLQFVLLLDDDLNPIKDLDMLLPETWTDITTGKEVTHRGLTLRKALITRHTKLTNREDVEFFDGSLFDNFVSSVGADAAADYTSVLDRLLAGNAAPAGPLDQNIVLASPERRGSQEFDFASKAYRGKKADPGQTYFFLCAGTNGGKGKAYMGQENVCVDPSTTPMVDFAEVHLQSGDSGGVTGTVTIHFTEQLYNVQRNSLNSGVSPRPQPLYATETGEDFIDEQHPGHVGVGQLPLRDNMYFTPVYREARDQQLEFRFHGRGAESAPLSSSASLLIAPYIDAPTYDTASFRGNTNALRVTVNVTKVPVDKKDPNGLFYWAVTATVSDGWRTKEFSCNTDQSDPVGGVPPEDITLIDHDITLTEGRTKYLAYIISPSGADRTLFWSSSDETVATVDTNGTVTAHSEGNATITVRTTVDGVEDSCEVTVDARPVTIKVKPTTLNLRVGNEATLDATTDPYGEYVTWESSNEDVATVDDYGTVTAVAQGKARITVSTDDGTTAVCNVTVSPPIMVSFSAATTSFNNLKVGNERTPVWTITPSNVADSLKKLTWESSNEDVATVSDKGVIKAVGVGTATITATTVDKNMATCTVTVIEEAAARR